MSLINRRGSIVVNGLMALGVSVVLVFSSIQFASNIRKETRRARVRSALTVLEKNITDRAQQPFAYVDCNSSGPISCNVNWDYFQSISPVPMPTTPPSKSIATLLQMPLTYAQCPPSKAKCGIVAKNVQLVTGATQPELHVTLEYEGVDFPVKPILLKISIWKEILQSDIAMCANGFFVGFDNSGKIVCRQPTSCGGNYIAAGIDAFYNATGCSMLPSTSKASELMESIAIMLDEPSTPANGKARQPVNWWKGK